MRRLVGDIEGSWEYEISVGDGLFLLRMYIDNRNKPLPKHQLRMLEQLLASRALDWTDTIEIDLVIEGKAEDKISLVCTLTNPETLETFIQTDNESIHVFNLIMTNLASMFEMGKGVDGDEPAEEDGEKKSRQTDINREKAKEVVESLEPPPPENPKPAKAEVKRDKKSKPPT